jgi:hypothetical protein
MKANIPHFTDASGGLKVFEGKAWRGEERRERNEKYLLSPKS